MRDGDSLQASTAIQFVNSDTGSFVWPCLSPCIKLLESLPSNCREIDSALEIVGR